MTDADLRLVTRYHRLLLEMSGRASDDIVTTARRLLAEGRISEAARAVLGAILADRLPITTADAELLVTTLPEVPDVGLLAGLELATPGGSYPAYDFAPVLPSPYAGPDDVLPMVLDLTGAVDLDPADAAAVGAIAELPGAIALWRAWRSPRPDDPGAGPARIYLLESAAEDTQLPGATAWLQDALSTVDVPDPQVEVYGPGTDLPSYQRLARGRAALLWATEPAGPVVIARVFDRVDPVTGPLFEPDHPVLAAGDETGRLLDYLRAGTVLLATTARTPDVLDPSRGDVVPVSFRTDGSFIWTDTVTYYLETYGLSPDAELLAAVRAKGYTLPPADAVAEHRAMVTLTTPVTV